MDKDVPPQCHVVLVNHGHLVLIPCRRVNNMNNLLENLADWMVAMLTNVRHVWP